MLSVSHESLVIRPLLPADAVTAHALSSRIGWPQRLEDWRWFAASSRGFVAEQAGTLVGTTLHWDYGHAVSSVGSVMVDPQRQGQGIGRRLMDACLDALQGRTVILHATPAGRPLYEKLGFTALTALSRHEGRVKTDQPMPATAGVRMVPLDLALAPTVLQLAEQASGLQRNALIESLIAISDGVVLFDGEVPIGFSLLRRYAQGWAIGPVVASSESCARALIGHWLGRLAGEFLRVDVPAHASPSFRFWLDSVGLLQVSSATPMVRGQWPVGDVRLRQFAIVTQATG